MRPREILARNLVALMKARPELSTFPKITAAGGPTNGTLDRIRRAESAAKVDELERLASVFKLEPWMLLVPDLDPADPPRLRTGARPMSEAELRETLLMAAEGLGKYAQR